MNLKLNSCLALLVAGLWACELDPNIEEAPIDVGVDEENEDYRATAYKLELPSNLPPQIQYENNEDLTQEKVMLGRMLFYDPILSRDSTVSCASCHNQAMAFTDNNKRFSVGVDDQIGDRTSMPLFNLAWVQGLMWDRRHFSMEEQIEDPITNPIEMDETWENVITKLSRHPDYPQYFRRAFRNGQISPENTSEAIAQFERIMVSGNSKFDKFQRNEPGSQLTQQEMRGFQLFVSEAGDCFHCHQQPIFTDGMFHNNGLDEVSSISEFKDRGVGAITRNPQDFGKFKTPSLRNVAVSAPYMHDGRFATLEEVIDHYDSGGKRSPTVSPLMKYSEDGLQLSQEDKDALVAFLKTLTDEEFLSDTALTNPFTR